MRKASVSGRVGRRVFLRLAGTGAATFFVPGCGDDGKANPVELPGYFTPDERRALGALADFVLPPDDKPGGSALGVVPYVETLLSALDHDPPLIHAGGPYSGRQPFADPATGAASTQFPDNEFMQFLPLSRVATVAWKLRLYGSAGVPGGGPNDAVTGPIKGLRDIVGGALEQAMQASPNKPLETLGTDAIQAIWTTLPSEFTSAFPELVVEAALAAPEYMGNTKLLGWEMVHVDGDVQPLGYSVFNEATGDYVERLPVSTPDSTSDPDPFDAQTKMTLMTITGFLGGRIGS